jgi:hypothetical protein
MTPEDDWNFVAPGREAQPLIGGLGSLRIALLFGSAAIALALLIVPFAEQRSGQQLARDAGRLDTISTGSISRTGGNYTIRRSVLQSNPNAVCIIRPNGTRSGDC